MTTPHKSVMGEGTVPRIIRAFNLCFGSMSDRRKAVKRAIKGQLRCEATGKGNKAWKRVESLNHDPHTLIWPNYLD